MLSVKASKVLSDLKLGDSIAVNGPCLTVTELRPDGFSVEATQETVKLCTIKEWAVGKKLNLERALKVSDRLGGHFVQGHVDGIGIISMVRFKPGHAEILIEADQKINQLIVPKGSITIDGVSLTISEKLRKGFKLVVVPFTIENTNLGELSPGRKVNIETDLILRWMEDRFQSIETKKISNNFQEFNNIYTED